MPRASPCEPESRKSSSETSGPQHLSIVLCADRRRVRLQEVPRTLKSLRDRRVFANDTNQMIGECRVHLGDLDLRHMAVYTVFRSNRARGAGVIPGGFVHWGRNMASEALCIVAGIIFRERLVGIVARNAGKPRVAVSPALALHQAIRLRANIGDACHVRELDVPPGAMAGSAKIDRITRTQPARIENQGLACFVPDSLLQLNGFHRLHMLLTRSVTRFADHSHSGFARVKLSSDVSSKAVAGEASQKLGGIHRARRGFREIVW